MYLNIIFGINFINFITYLNVHKCDGEIMGDNVTDFIFHIKEGLTYKIYSFFCRQTITLKGFLLIDKI